MTRSLLNPVIIIPVIGLVLILLGYVFDHTKSCRRFAPLCRFLCLGVILGCAVGLIGEFIYDFIERWLFQNLPVRAVTRAIDVVFDQGYARIFGTLSGAAGAVWFWFLHREKVS